MALLTFFKDNQELMKYVLRQEATSVGRSSSCDICLPDSNISRTHFVISFVNAKFLIVDKSTNGTSVQNELIVSRELLNGDRIQIGDWEILFSSESGFETRQITHVVGRDPTEVLSYEPEKHELKFRRAMIEYGGTKKNTFKVTKEIVTIGKSKSNDICLSNDTFVSNFHCKIENRRGQYFLKDLKSTNGTFVNNQQIIETSIGDDTTFTVGKTKLTFRFKEEKEKLKPLAGKQFHGMLGNTSVMRNLYAVISRIAMSDATVMIHGETGTGKELVARAIHDLSPRSGRKLVILNCSAIAKDLIESELFGHEKGAFTSAHQQRRGAFEEANGGTLFLDEIGDLPLELQPKILRVLENREIKRVGSNALVDVDVRVITASHRDLPALVQEGRFREDLFFRLYVVPLIVPALRERVDDITLLAEYFLVEAGGEQKQPKSFSATALEALMAFEWPGNVRELKNLVSRAVLNAQDAQIEVKDLQFAPKGLKEKTLFDKKAGATWEGEGPKTLKDYEREKILSELKKNRWNKKKTAEMLGIAKTTLFEKIKKYGLKQENQE